MTSQAQIKAHISSIPQPKQNEVQALHNLMLKVAPAAKLWFYDGKDDSGKVVANPTIGYAQFMMKYADGTSKEWFRIGISANTTGISVYILGIPDKTYLAQTFGKTLGKAKVTGYCIKFKSLKDIDLNVLTQAITYGLQLPG